MPHINGFMLLMLRTIPQQSADYCAVCKNRNRVSGTFVMQVFQGHCQNLYDATIERNIDSFWELQGRESVSKAVSDENHRIGVRGLIHFVKDDEVVSRTILQSFIDETDVHIKEMRNLFEEKDIHAISGLAHKMLPLFRMMKNKVVVDLLSLLEKKEEISADEEQKLLDLLLQVLQRLKN